MTAAKRKTFMECSPAFSSQHTTAQNGTPSTPALRQSRSDLQDFGDCIQSSQIGPHLVQPLRARPMATTPKISANRLNMADLFPMERIIRPRARHYQAMVHSLPSVPFREMRSRMRSIAGGTVVHADRPTNNGIRYRGGPAHPWRRVRTLGAGSRAVD